MTEPETLLEAALAYAARGWPVFPCNPKHKQPLLASKRDEDDKPIRGTGGVSAASVNPDTIRAWWKKWPKALIGLATGHPTTDAAGLRLFVLDFDPRVDDDTGEVWGLAGLKSDTEAQIGCPLPESLAGLTPSDGVHLYLLQDDGEPITNRGNLPQHVDVRGLGGYVIAPPSVMGPNAIKGQANLRYRWHRREPIGGIAKAPEGLLRVLRERKGAPAAVRDGREPSPPPRGDTFHDPSDSVRKYALAALDGELQAVRRAPSGGRNAQLNESAFKIAALVAAGAVDQAMARGGLEAAARDNPGNDDDRQLLATIDSGWSAGIVCPRDLSQIEADARERIDRNRSSPNRARQAQPSDRPPPPAAAMAGQGQPFRSGSARVDTRREGADERPPRPLTAADKARLTLIAEHWLAARLDAIEASADEFKKVAWGVGRRISAGYLDRDVATSAIWEAVTDDGVDDLTHDDVLQAIADGLTRGFDPAAPLLDLDCARYPMTDFGIAERFRDRFGAEFRFTTAKGWLGWDGRRWKLLDQDKDTPPAELIAAVFETIRAVQREAKRVAETGTKWRLVTVFGPRGGEQQQIADEEAPNPHAADHWIAKGKGFILFSEAIAGFGRQSESAGKPTAIAALARRWLTVPIEQFDCEQMAINVLNGTLRFVVEAMPDGKRCAAVQLHPHRREDLITRLAPVDYDREARAPLYDGMIAWAQPEDSTRRYLHQIGGYSITGDTGEHFLWFHYGRGRNGKSVTIDSWSSALGDYSGVIGVESLLDQGIKKRGDAATPDLAKLGGVRLLRASEPERGAKLNAALVKMATGGEPMSVRALHKGFFDLLPRFKLQMSGNIKPSIPDTDDGIWGRMKLVPWLRHIEKPHEDPFRDRFPDWHRPDGWPEKDTKLGDKIKAAELPGVFLRLVQGLVDYLQTGFVEPDSVTQATEAYRAQSDPLQRFLSLCTEADPKSRVKSSELHDVFAAWCKAAGEKEWSPKGFSDALTDKGFTKVRSDGMRWEGLRLIRSVGDFVDPEGRVRLMSDDLSTEPHAPSAAAATARPFREADDDLPIG